MDILLSRSNGQITRILFFYFSLPLATPLFEILMGTSVPSPRSLFQKTNLLLSSPFLFRLVNRNIPFASLMFRREVLS